ncbi:hypothetical protein [Nocardioides sp. SYSU DS0651]|uniref:hypothetical protein n=1 Tax=Nocardioides sp. SYSU DS0651 TaxID=3415955 RepID=UPI003F4BF125
MVNDIPPAGDDRPGPRVGSSDLPPDGVAMDGTPVDQLEQERAERLDPANRAEEAEIDNTHRDFDVEKGMFTDNPDYDRAPKKFPPLGEGGA